MKKGIFYCYCFLIFITATAAYAGAFRIGDSIDNIGVTLPMQAGFINLRIENNYFNLYFLDKDKKIIKCPINGVTIQFAESKKRSKKYVSVMEPSATGVCLVGKRVIKRPYDYVVSIFIKENTQDKPSSNVKETADKEGEEAFDINQNALVSAVKFRQI